GEQTGSRKPRPFAAGAVTRAGDSGQVRLVSWNVAGRTDGPTANRLCAQAEALADERPDLVALQEVTRETIGVWRDRLSQQGLDYCADTVGRLRANRR